MNFIIEKHFTFDSSHILPDKEIYGKCSRLHGHTYKLQVEITGKVTKDGWICNFSTIKDYVNKLVIDVYDHNHLNCFFILPTAENIALKIFEDLDAEIQKTGAEYSLKRITLYETPTSYAIVER